MTSATVATVGLKHVEENAGPVLGHVWWWRVLRCHDGRGLFKSWKHDDTVAVTVTEGSASDSRSMFVTKMSDSVPN